jgi:hypothetical protein
MLSEDFTGAQHDSLAPSGTAVLILLDWQP